MNKRMIAFILGRIFLTEAILMLPAVLTGVIYGESEIFAFAPAIAALALLGLIFGLKRPKNTAIYARDGFFAVSAAWLLMSFFGALPFYFSGCFNSFFDCFFEMVSGFTTTGATVLSDPGSLPRCILLWRSFSNWIGGMGVLVFALAVVPLSDDHSLYLMRAESPGPIVGKLVPKMKDTAKILYGVYTVLTVVLTVLLLIGGMPPFDAVCHAFSTAGTGGFSVRTEGIAYYDSAYIDYVISIFMLIFGINFNLFYLILAGKARDAIRSEELRWFLLIVVGATAIVGINVYPLYGNAGDTVRYAFFQVSTIISTTGYATADFALWPQLCRQVLVLLMLLGSCAGSTSGGFKVSRLMILLKTLRQEIKRLIHPRAVTVVSMEGKSVGNTVIRSTLVYTAMYFVIMIVSTVLIAVDGFDFTTTLTAEITCFNNVGPGLAGVGPMSNFSAFSNFSKIILSVNMLIGRLEILPMLVLFSPGIWKKSVY